jgi:GH18 family chitinase
MLDYFYRLFFKYLSRTFKDEYRKNFRKLILSAFVASNEKRIDDGYDVELICRYLDYASVATYDYTGPSDSKTGYNAPLYSRSSENNNVNSSIHYWLDRGCPSNKLLMGIPTYARGFKVTRKPNSPSMLHLGIESEPFLNPSLYTSEEGVVSYYEVCELMKNKDTKVYWDDVSLVPFAIVNNDLAKNTPKNPSSSTWISYEDSRSARKKAEYVKQMALGGVSIWALDMDDFKGQFCNLGPYPIIESIKQELDRTILINPEENTEYSSLSTKKTIDLTTKERLKDKNYTNDVTLLVNNIGENLMTTGKVAYDSTTKISLKYNSTYELSNKKFHAVKHIKIIASLDKNKRQTNSSSKMIFSLLSISFYFLIKSTLL